MNVNIEEKIEDNKKERSYLECYCYPCWEGTRFSDAGKSE